MNPLTLKHILYPRVKNPQSPNDVKAIWGSCMLFQLWSCILTACAGAELDGECMWECMCARVCTHSSCQVCQSFLFFSYFFFSLPTVPSLLPLACTDTHPCVCIRICSLCKMLHVAIALCLCGSLLVSRPTPAQTTNAPPDLLLIILSRFECDHLQQPVGTLSSSRLKLAMSPRTGDSAGIPGTRHKKKRSFTLCRVLVAWAGGASYGRSWCFHQNWWGQALLVWASVPKWSWHNLLLHFKELIG